MSSCLQPREVRLHCSLSEFDWVRSPGPSGPHATTIASWRRRWCRSREGLAQLGELKSLGGILWYVAEPAHIDDEFRGSGYAVFEEAVLLCLVEIELRRRNPIVVDKDRPSCRRRLNGVDVPFIHHGLHAVGGQSKRVRACGRQSGIGIETIELDTNGRPARRLTINA